MLDLLFGRCALFSTLLGFLGWIPRVHMIQPRNPNPSFLILFLISLHKYAFVLILLCIYESLFHC